MPPKSSVGNAQILAALKAGQALCDPTGNGKHIIKGKTVFQQGPGNNQNPTWSKISFATKDVTFKGDLLCVLASIIDMIGDPSTTTPGRLAQDYKGLATTLDYNTNKLIKQILNDHGLAVLPIEIRSDIFRYMLAYNGYVILFGKGGAENSPPFITPGHFVYIHTYDPDTDLYYIGQSFGNQAALLDHVRGYKITELIKLTPAEGGVITAFGVIANSKRRGSTTVVISSGGKKVAATADASKKPFNWLGLGTTELDRDARLNNKEGGVENYTFADKAKTSRADTTWGNEPGSFNDNLTQTYGERRAWVPAGTTKEGYGIFRNINWENENADALLKNQSPPHSNTLFISLVASEDVLGINSVGSNEIVAIEDSFILWTTDANGNTTLPSKPDQYVVYGVSPDGYAIYINLTQTASTGLNNTNTLSGVPKFIKLDGNYITYITVPNPSYTVGGSVPYLKTQIAPGTHNIMAYNNNSPSIATITV